MDKNIRKLIAQNKRARYDYFIEQTMEAGIVLTGTEVKSLRNGKVSISESHATQMEGEIYIMKYSYITQELLQKIPEWCAKIGMD